MYLQKEVNMERFFNPRSVAIIGASEKLKFGRGIYEKE